MNKKFQDLGIAAPAAIAPLGPLLTPQPYHLPTAKPTFKLAAPNLLGNVFEVSTQFHNNLPQALPLSTKGSKFPQLLLPPMTPTSGFQEEGSLYSLVSQQAEP